MSDQNPVPLIVLSTSRNHAEEINGMLRRAGHAVHCSWIAGLRDFSETLAEVNPELVLYLGPADADLKDAATLRDRESGTVPIIVIDTDTSEERIAERMRLGARDVVSMGSAARLAAVVTRELRAHRLEKAFRNTMRTARDARRQLASVLERSNDAIAQVQEGILVDANASWLGLFGFQRDDIVGQPVMDLFEPTHQMALRGALAACLSGRWSDHPLSAGLRFADGSHRVIDVMLALGEHDSEPSVQLIIHARPDEDPKLEEQLTDAVQRDPGTGLLHRMPLLKAVYERMKTPVPGGSRWFAVVKPDHFTAVERDVGVFGSEAVLEAFTTQVREGLHPNETFGRLGGVSFLVLLERGNKRDAEAWGAQLTARVAKHSVSAGGKSVSITCTVGIASTPSITGLKDTEAQLSIDAAISSAMEACRASQKKDEGKVVLADRADDREQDDAWIKRIRQALMNNRFRLVQQPIASLQGVDSGMFDVLVRMLDEAGHEILPGEFLPAAARHDLLKNIDRWVVGASLAFAAVRKPGCLFVRLSRDTLTDGSFLGWVDNQVRSSRVDPQRLCFQVTGEILGTHLRLVRKLSEDLHTRGFRFAIESFGSESNAQSLLSTMLLDFVKIDGAVVQGLTSSPDLQERVKQLVEAAKARNIETIAERVEDANTMAVLWQLGVQYLQGYLVHAPEEIVL